MLPNSFLSVRGKILGFPSKDSNYISNSKKNSSPFKKAQKTNTLQQFLEKKSIFWKKIIFADQHRRDYLYIIVHRIVF